MRCCVSARQPGEEEAVLGAWVSLLDQAAAQGARIVGRAFGESLDQAVAVGGDVVDPISCLSQRLQDVDGARRRIQADAVADATILVGIVGEHEGDAPFGRRRAPQPNPVGRELGHELDPIGLRFVADDVGFGQRVAPGDALERDGARDDASVHLRQCHVHRDVAGGKALRAVAPGARVAAGENHLQHRAVAGAERADAIARVSGGGDGEARRVQDDVGRRFRQQAFDRRRRNGILQAGDVDGQRREAGARQRLDQRIDDGEVSGLHQRPVEHQRRDRRVRAASAAARSVARSAMPPSGQ